MALHSPRSQYAHLLTPCVVCGRPFIKSDMRAAGDGSHVCRPCIRADVRNPRPAPKSPAVPRPGKKRRARSRSPRYQDA